MKVWTQYVIILVVLLIIGSAIYLYDKNERETILADTEINLTKRNELNNYFNFLLPYAPKYAIQYPLISKDKLYIKGKPIIINMDKMELDTFHLIFIYKQYKISDQNDIKTVIQHNTERILVGQYTDGKKAYQSRYTIRVIDLDIPGIVYENVVLGKAPLSERIVETDIHGNSRDNLYTMMSAIDNHDPLDEFFRNLNKVEHVE